MSFESAETLLLTIWYSLDDIFVCVGFFLLAKVLAEYTHWCLYQYFRTSPYTAQAFHFAFLFAIFVFLVGHLLGESVTTSLLSGFSIGFGYAMQPYIVSLLRGAAFRSGVVFPKDDSEKITIRINDEEFQLDHIGLLHVCVTANGFKTYFPNSYLGSTPISIKYKE
tara:strand:+ start:51 stop:548 length:498 start_codon:yes stop_codon:yes gene_type:complete